MIQSKKVKKFQECFPDFFYITCLAIVSVYFFRDFGSTIYFDPHDESVYLHRHITFGGPGKAEWGPLYSIFYWIQGLWQKDLLQLYYQNAVLISFFLPLSFYWFLRRYGVSAYFSAIVGYLFLISDYNLFLFPKAAHFQLVLIFVYLGFAAKIKCRSVYLVNLIIFSLFLMFIRPKMIVMPLLLLIYSAYSHKRFFLKLTKAGLIKYALASFLFASLLSYYGNPIGDRGKKEAVFFQNHHLNRLDREILIGGKLEPVEQSLSGYAKEFNEHVKQNLRNLFSNLSQHRFHFPYLNVFESPANSNNFQMIFLLAGIFGVAILNWKTRGASKLERFHFYFPVIHSLLCISTTLIIYAWARFFFVIIMYSALFLSYFSPREKCFRNSLICCGFFLLQTVIPNSFNSADAIYLESKQRGWGMEKSIKLLRELKGLTKGKCLANPFYISVYIDHLCTKESEPLKGIFQHGEFGLWKQIEKEKPRYVFIGREYFDQWIQAGNTFEPQKFYEKLLSLGYRTIVLSLENEEFFLVKYPATGEAR
jgi:hypothetical protein